MSVVEFKLPASPTEKDLSIVLEKPRKNSVWYLRTGKDESVPLSTLKREPTEIGEVVDAIKEQQGENWLRNFVQDGYSAVDLDGKKNKKTYQLDGLI